VTNLFYTSSLLNNQPMLSHLVYVSSRKRNCTDGEIDHILEACKKNNPSLDITGVLLYSPTKFIQYVEGESRQLTTLYEKIKRDSRHEQVRLISYGPIKEKAFPSWHMATKPVSQREFDFRTDINADDKQTFKRLLTGDQQEGSRVLQLLQKFFD
jgi:hypothetical protein